MAESLKRRKPHPRPGLYPIGFALCIIGFMIFAANPVLLPFIAVTPFGSGVPGLRGSSPYLLFVIFILSPMALFALGVVFIKLSRHGDLPQPASNPPAVTVRRRVTPIRLVLLIGFVATAFLVLHSLQNRLMDRFELENARSFTVFLADLGVDQDDLDALRWQFLSQSAEVSQEMHWLSLITNLFWVLLLAVVAVFPVVRHEIRDAHDKPEPERDTETSRETEIPSPSRTD